MNQRMLIALHANLSLSVEHFDIKYAYLHERYEYDIPVYVQQMQNFDGTYRHHSKYGKIEGDLYDSSPAAFYYNHGLKTFLHLQGHLPSEHGKCLYILKTPTGFILVSTTIDDFLVLASDQLLINELHKQLLTKYKIKRLGTSIRFLNWAITHSSNGQVHIAQPDSIDALLQQTNMPNCNPAYNP